MKVNVKWNKEVYSDLDLDMSLPPLIFKTQVFTLTGVPPDRQKVMIKGVLLKDDDWGRAAPRDNMTLLLMGSADAVSVAPPQQLPTFVEDLPEAEQDHIDSRAYGTGLTNLGNTCYMNSTLQCLYSVVGLRDALESGSNSNQTAAAGATAPSSTSQPHGNSNLSASSGILSAAASGDPTTRLVAATRDLFQKLQTSGVPFSPFRFLLALRELYPQFAQRGREGEFMQQDAEECWSQVMYVLRERLKAQDGASIVQQLFGIRLETTFKAEETDETFQDSTDALMLKCNITSDVNYLSQGITRALVDDREKHSAALGRTVLFKGTAQVARLPPHLTVQMVRFFYKADVQQKAKILRKVTFPMDLDLYEFCSDELKKSLDKGRRIQEDRADSKQESTQGDASSHSSGLMTGHYQLQGLLTHKGRSADSGHYVAWIKQPDGKWALFDDDQITSKTEEEIMALSGGGDWHMAYLLLYRAVTVPEATA